MAGRLDDMSSRVECGQARGAGIAISRAAICRSISSFANTSNAAMTERDERSDCWVPAPGQIVQVKPGFKGSIIERAFNRASEEGGPKLKLDEKMLYEVIQYEQKKDRRVLQLQEVKIIYIAGQRFVTKGNEVPYPLSIELFQLSPKHNNRE